MRKRKLSMLTLKCLNGENLLLRGKKVEVTKRFHQPIIFEYDDSKCDNASLLFNNIEEHALNGGYNPKPNAFLLGPPINKCYKMGKAIDHIPVTFYRIREPKK